MPTTEYRFPDRPTSSHVTILTELYQFFSPRINEIEFLNKAENIFFLFINFLKVEFTIKPSPVLRQPCSVLEIPFPPPRKHTTSPQSLKKKMSVYVFWSNVGEMPNLQNPKQVAQVFRLYIPLQVLGGKMHGYFSVSAIILWNIFELFMRYHQFCVSAVNTWSKADVQGSLAPRQHRSVSQLAHHSQFGRISIALWYQNNP